VIAFTDEYSLDALAVAGIASDETARTSARTRFRALRDVLGVMVVVMMVLALISGLLVIVARVWPPDETRLRCRWSAGRLRQGGIRVVYRPSIRGLRRGRPGRVVSPEGQIGR
jgi:hypothetical protein